MLSGNPGNKKNLYVPDYVVFDLETTGVSPNTDEVIEISAVKVCSGKVVDEFSTLVDPGRPIPYYATMVNGISNDMVEGQPSFQSALSSFLSFTGDMVLVGHNIHCFDMKFLYRDAKKFFGKTIGNDYVDTLSLSRIIYPQLSSHKLTYLAEYLGLSTEGAHRALKDCHMNQVLYEKMGEEIQKGNTGTMKICPMCGSPMVKRKSAYGLFWGCSNYPNCKCTRDIQC